MDALEDEVRNIFGPRKSEFGNKSFSCGTKNFVRKMLEPKIECDHSKLEQDSEDDSTLTCPICGCLVERITFNPEWKSYADGKDISRCKETSSPSASILKSFFQGDLGKLVKIDIIRKETEAKYLQVTGNEMIRGKKRKAIAAACLLYAYHDHRDMRTAEEVRKMVGISKKDMSFGLTTYNVKIPSHRSVSIRPKDLIKRIMIKIDLDLSLLPSIVEIADQVDTLDDVLSRSAPQSVAAAIVYFYIVRFYRSSPLVKKTVFSKKVDLSDITVSKLYKRIEELLPRN